MPLYGTSSKYPLMHIVLLHRTPYPPVASAAIIFFSNCPSAHNLASSHNGWLIISSWHKWIGGSGADGTLYTHTRFIHTFIHIRRETNGKIHMRPHLTVQQLPTWIRAGWVPVKWTHLIHWATASLFEWTATLITIADLTSIDEPFPWWGLLFWEYTRHLLSVGQKNDHSTAGDPSRTWQPIT